MSGTEGRKNTTAEELQKVHNRIEQCLSNYMTQQEVLKALYVQHNIDPRFTQLVWEQLERQNQEFFNEYYLRLTVKAQIIKFNRLLSKQAEMMYRRGSSGIASVAMSNGSKVSSGCNNVSTRCFVENGGPGLKSEDVHHRQNSATLPDVFDSGGGTSVHRGIETVVDLSSHGGNNDVTGNILMGHDLVDEEASPIGNKFDKSELGYPEYLPYRLGTRNDPMESCHVPCDPPVGSFSRIESNSEHLNGVVNHLNGTLVDSDPSLFGYLGQNSLNFGFSDLEAEFIDVPDILGSYSRSSFLSPDRSNFPDTHGLGENQGDVANSSVSPESFKCLGHGNN